MQKHFQCEFHVLRHSRIPSHNTILKLVNDFNASGSAVHMLVCAVYSIHTAENVERVRRVIAAESNTLDKVAHGHLTDVKQVLLKNSP